MENRPAAIAITLCKPSNRAAKQTMAKGRDRPVSLGNDIHQTRSMAACALDFDLEVAARQLDGYRRACQRIFHQPVQLLATRRSHPIGLPLGTQDAQNTLFELGHADRLVRPD